MYVACRAVLLKLHVIAVHIIQFSTKKLAIINDFDSAELCNILLKNIMGGAFESFNLRMQRFQILHKLIFFYRKVQLFWLEMERLFHFFHSIA